MKDFLSFVLFIVCLLGGSMAVVFLIVWATTPMRDYSCQARWAPAQTEYTLIGGCRVKVGFGDDSFVPEKNIRVGG